MQLGHVAEADGRWRLYVFGGEGDRCAPGSAIHQLCDWLAEDAASPVRRYTHEGEDVDAIIDVRAVFQQTFTEVDFEAAPQLLKPAKGRYGLVDFEKVFCLDHKGLGDIYEMRGIDRSQGCMIVVRPDQYVANILPLTAYGELGDFFDGCLLTQI